MQQRAEATEETRTRIIRATIELHDERGVATTSQADVAARAGVAPATVYRHFPTLGSLVQACGSHVWELMAPPLPQDAPRLFAGLDTTPERLRRFSDEVSAFYARGRRRLEGAREDRGRVPELDGFLRRVEAGLEALACEALTLEQPTEQQVRLTLALTDFGVWQALRDHGITEDAVPGILTDLLSCALGYR